MVPLLPQPQSAAPLPRSRTAAHLSARARLLAVAAVALALVAGLFAVPTRAEARLIIPAVPVRSVTEKALAAAVLVEFNLERAVHHLKPVRMNSQLQLSARRHDVLMARTNTLSHQLANEPVFSTRISEAGYKWTWAAENIAFNSAMTLTGVLGLQKMMYNERPPADGHRVNILNSRYTDIGVDVLLDYRNHRVWLTTDLGRR